MVLIYIKKKLNFLVFNIFNLKMSAIKIPIHESKELLNAIDLYFNTNLTLPQKNKQYLITIGMKWSNHFTYFKYNNIEKYAHLDVLNKIAKLVVRAIELYEMDNTHIFISLITHKLITISDLYDLFDFRSFIMIKNELGKNKSIDINLKYCTINTPICTWDNLLTIITNHNFSDIDRKDFSIYCFKKFDEILKNIIYIKRIHHYGSTAIKYNFIMDKF